MHIGGVEMGDGIQAAFWSVLVPPAWVLSGVGRKSVAFEKSAIQHSPCAYEDF